MVASNFDDVKHCISVAYIDLLLMDPVADHLGVFNHRAISNSRAAKIAVLEHPLKFVITFESLANRKKVLKCFQ